MRYSSEAPSPVASQGLVLGALALLGIGGYIYLKPVRDVATKLNTGIDKAAVLTDSAKDAAGKATSVAKDAAGRAGEVAKTAAKKATDGDAGDGSLLSLATTALSKAGPGLAGLATAGGLGGILSKLKDVDISGALDLLKATGSDEIGKVVDIVQKKVKDVDGKVEDIDWRALATELNEELGGKYKSTIDVSKDGSVG
jgi:hypothetical protein